MDLGSPRRVKIQRRVGGQESVIRTVGGDHGDVVVDAIWPGLEDDPATVR